MEVALAATPSTRANLGQSNIRKGAAVLCAQSPAPGDVDDAADAVAIAAKITRAVRGAF